MLRKIGGVLAGVVVVGVVVATIQWVGGMLYPLPEGLNPNDPAQADALADHVAGMPTGAWALAFLSELIGGFCGALVAAKIATGSERMVAGFVVAVALVFSVMNWVAFAHPMWFIVGQLVGYPLVLMAAWKALGVSGRAEPA